MQKPPDRSQWEKFWKDQTRSRFRRVSWSKRRIQALLAPQIRPGMSVLDAGSGSGFFSAYFLDMGCRVTSLDYSETSLALTREATGNRSSGYLCQNLLDPSWMAPYNSAFDLIFTDGLFEHFDSQIQREIMGHFIRLKKPEGVIATFVPNRFSWWEIVRPWVMPGIHEDPFTPEKLSDLHQGLEIIKTGGVNVLPFRWSPEKSLGARWGMLLYCLAR